MLTQARGEMCNESTQVVNDQWEVVKPVCDTCTAGEVVTNNSTNGEAATHNKTGSACKLMDSER